METLLRSLKETDAPYMLEWMHDAELVSNLRHDFAKMSIEDCRTFIRGSINNDRDVHYAIANEDGEYLGTCSLKNLNADEGTAEFGIVIRRKAMGTGTASMAMNELLNHKAHGFGVRYVFWCVNPENARAIKFYDKNGFTRAYPEKNRVLYLMTQNAGYSDEEINRYYWYEYQV